VFSRLRQLADRSFVAGIILVLELTLSTWFHPATISIPLDSTACPILKFKIEK
jgi:hypothetical protein